MKAVPLLVATCLALLLSACSPSAKGTPAKDLIVGKWQTPTGGTMAFDTGGRLTMAGPKGSVDVTYSFPTDTTLEVKKPDAAARIRYQVTFPSPQEAVLTEANGQRMKLKRVE